MASLWSRILGRVTSKADAVGSDLFAQGLADWGNSATGVPVNTITALQHTAVMACVTILAEDLAKLPLQIFRRLENGGKEPAKDHVLYALLRRPNPWQTRMEWIEMMQAALVLRSAAYSAIFRDGRGKPVMLVPMHPDRVTLYEAPDGEYFYYMTPNGLHEMAIFGDAPLMVPSEDTLHIRGMAVWNSLLGVSRIRLMQEAIGVSIAQEQQTARFAKNGARPSGGLKTPKKLSPEAYKRVRESWAEAQGGWQNAGRVAILEEGLEWQQMGLTMLDAEFLATRRYQLEDIARGFRVPLHKLGVPTEGGGPSLAQQDQEYINNVLAGYGTRWIAKMAQYFGVDAPSAEEAQPGETFLEFDYEAMFKADPQTRYTSNRIAIVGGFKTVNEIRRREGDPKDPKGDVLLQPTNMAPLGWTPPAKGAGPGSDTTGAPAPGGDGDPGKLPGLPGESAE